MMQYTGHVEKRSESSYLIVIEQPRIKGKRKRIYRSFKGNKKQAEAELRRLLNELERGKYVEPSKLTTGEYLERWLQDYGMSNLADSTFESYERIIKKHVIPEIGGILLTELKALQLQEYETRKLKSGLSKRTVQYHHRIIREALQHAIDWQLLAYNPGDAVKAPKAERPEIVVPGIEGIKKLIEAETPDRMLIITALFTGMRRGELLGLRWSDIDMDNNRVAVIQQVQDIKGKGIVFKKSPKGGEKSRRNITVPGFLIALLRHHKAEQNEIRLMHGENYKDCALVFPRLDGSPERPSNVSHRFKHLVDKLKLNGMRFHDCRHFHATLLMSMNVADMQIKERFGWSTIKMLEIYAHVSENMQNEIAVKLDDLFKNMFGLQSGDNQQK
jgi:integrase